MSERKHVGAKMRKQKGFDIGKFSKSYVLGDNNGRVMFSLKAMEEMVEKQIIGDGVSQFRLHSTKSGIMLLCGQDQVHDQKEDIVFLPNWMQEYLDAYPGDTIFVSSMQLEICTYIKLKPDSCEFYEQVSEDQAKMVMTRAMQNASAVIKGQWMLLNINMKGFWFQVVDCAPEMATLQSTCSGFDIKVDFESADGLEEWEKKKQAANALFAMEKSDFYQSGGVIKEEKPQKLKIQNKDEMKFELSDDPEEALQKELAKTKFAGKGRKL